MPTPTIPSRSTSGRPALEQAIAHLEQLHRLTLDAPNGTVLDACDSLALNSGRDLLRDTLAAVH